MALTILKPCYSALLAASCRRIGLRRFRCRSPGPGPDTEAAHDWRFGRDEVAPTGDVFQYILLPAARTLKPVALVSMPTLSARFPSFQLALLKPTLERAGIPAQTFSLFMYFGSRIGWRINEAIADVWPSLVGEWIWTRAAFGDEIEANDAGYFKAYEHVFRAICRQAGCTRARFRGIRDKDAPDFIDFCVDAVDWSRFGLIGFSLVFQQTLASLALARALKQRYPDIPIIFGGASLEDDIADEIMRGCPQVDYLHCGDGELSFPEMVSRLYRGESMRGLPGLMWRNGEAVEYAGRAPNFMAMDDTPIPEFDEYFYARVEGGYEEYEDACEPMLPIETARGCWWGEKHHCTFCGLNRSGMEFRSKDPARVLEQLEYLARRYDVFHFNAIDNIMATEYADQVFRKLAEANSDLEIHYEIRPYFSRAQLGRMRKGGLTSVQPGVESLSHERAQAHAQADDRHAQHRADQVVHVLRHQQHVQHPDAVPGRDGGRLSSAGGGGAEDRALAAALRDREGACRPRLTDVHRPGLAIDHPAHPGGLLRLHLSAQAV